MDEPRDDPATPDQEILDRQLTELLGEIRVILPGATVLFAFLLTLPFSSSFSSVSLDDRLGYFTAFMTSALSIILLTAQSAYHQLRGKPYDKALMLRTASRQTLAALILLAISITSVVFLIADVVYPGWIAPPLAAAFLAFIVTLWFVLPLVRRLRRDR
jgi:hypothetical protein